MDQAPENKAPENKYRAPALEKGLDILELLSEHADGLTQVEIAKLLGRTANQNYRMLATLERRGYLTRTESGEQYMLSMQLFVLAHRHPPMRRLLNRAMPILRKTAEKARQSIQIVVNNQGTIFAPGIADSPCILGLTIRAQTNFGLYNSAAGNVLCAFASEQDCSDIISAHHLVEGEAFVSRAAFNADLDIVRARGYAEMPSEILQGVMNLAYPVLGPNGEAIAAIACPYLPRIDVGEDTSFDDVKTYLGQAAKTLSMSNPT